MFNLLNGIVNTVKSIFGGSPKPAAPKPAPAPAPLKKLAPLPYLPAPNFYIANLGDSAATRAAGAARNQQISAATSKATGQITSTLDANRLAMEANQRELARQAAIREQQRKDKQAALDQTVASLKADRTKRAQQALDATMKKNGGTMLSWKSYLNDDGTIKAKGQKVDGFEIPENWYNDTNTVKWAKSEWQKWYNSDAGTFQKAKDEYRQKAQSIIDQTEKGQKGGVWDWFTGGSKDNARAQAQKALDDLNTNQTKRYDDKLNKFLKDQAAKKAAIEQTKFKTQAEFDKAVKEFSDWENTGISDLEYTRGASAGLAEGYTGKAQEENKSPLGTAGSWFNKNVVNGLPGQFVGGIWKYTLGEGDENVPSIMTAPSRALNALGNATWNAGGDKNLKDGSTVKGFEKGKNAWTQTFNQRNINLAPHKDVPFTAMPEDSPWIGDNLKARLWNTLGKGANDLSNGLQGGVNNAVEFAADPWMVIPAGKIGDVGKVAGWGSKAAEVAKTTKTGAAFFGAADKIAKSKAVQWLGKEYKTPDQVFSDAYNAAKVGTTDLNKTLGARINAVNQKLAGKDQIDTKILDDLKGLSDHEAGIVQRMIDGKFGTFRDRLAMKDIRGLQYSAPTREKLLDISKRWNDFAEKMKLSDEVTKTSFGGKNKTYSPFIDYTGEHNADNYNFFARKKNTKRIQSAEDLARNAETRYLKSNLGADLAKQAGETRSAWITRRSKLVSEYDARFNALTEPVKAANKKRGTISRYIKQRAAGVAPTTSLGRSVFNTARNVAGAPTKIWKQSVLKYRPAWTVNNVLYNTQAAGLAGGGRALVEQAKMLRPKNWKAAMADVPDAVKADLTGEMGKGKLNKFYNGVENWSRVAAFRGAKAKGLSDTEALKRVDKYLFNYKTKNFERPLKTVMPFYAWNKNLAKAAISMPFDRPRSAMAYHQIDQYQQNQFDSEFEKVVPELTKLGYSEDEIQKIKEDQAKYYKGRLKVGNQWITTPFNAFSEKGLTGLGFNPYASAVGESATATDSFGRKIGGEDAKLSNRIASKFPQYELGKKAFDSWNVQTGKTKPVKGWIGEKGSEGYGLTKERQGSDPSKPNYDRNLDPRAKLAQDALAFVGVPRGLEFDTNKLVEAKKLQKMSDEYFALDTKNMDYPTAEAAREAVFKKYGMTADQFYKGVLSKYDTQNTTRIKGLKEDAAAANKSLFTEYAAQPAGTRNMWATEKLRQLNDQGYFNDNPFLKSFDWVNPTTVTKADRQATYLDAKKTGDFSKWSAKYGDTRKVSAKKIAYEKAAATGDWTAYRKDYGVSTKQTPYQYDGKYFKSADSMQKYKNGQFWAKYAEADKNDRKKLLADNPEFNQRADWTDSMWNTWKSDKKKKEITKARGWGDFAATQDANKAAALVKANAFTTKRKAGSPKRLTWG